MGMLFKICAWNWRVRLMSFFFCFSVVFRKTWQRPSVAVLQKWRKCWWLNSIWVFQGTSIIAQFGFAPCRGIQDSVEFWVVDSSSFSVELGFQLLVRFRILTAVFRISGFQGPGFQNSTSKNFPDSGIQIPLRWAIGFYYIYIPTL